jgi:hypothetical protein
MNPPVRLDDRIDAPEFDSEEVQYYLDRRTGLVVAVEQSTLDAAESEHEKKLVNLPDWQRQELEKTGGKKTGKYALRHG